MCALACKAGSGDPTPTATTPASALVVATTKGPTAVPGGDGICEAQPYAHRCDPACKHAHETAIRSTCAAETNAFTTAVPSQSELGKCLVGCRKPGSDSTCIGAADKAGCECQLACYRSLPAAAIEKAKAAERCYARAILAACG